MGANEDTRCTSIAWTDERRGEISSRGICVVIALNAIYHNYAVARARAETGDKASAACGVASYVILQRVDIFLLASEY